jgi:hypothetical protein
MTIEQVRIRAEEFADSAGAVGFEEVAERQGLETTRTGFFEEGESVPTLGQFRAANIFAFAAEEGEVSDPFFERERYYVFTLARRDSSRIASLEEVEEDVKTAVMREKRLELAREEAEKSAPLARESASLERIARQADRAVESASSVPRIGAVPGVGPDTKLILAAFRAPDDEVAGPLSTEFGSYYLRRTALHPIDEEAYGREKGVLLRSLLAERQGHLFSLWLEEKKEKATIEDKRPPVPGAGELASG